MLSVRVTRYCWDLGVFLTSYCIFADHFDKYSKTALNVYILRGIANGMHY